MNTVVTASGLSYEAFNREVLQLAEGARIKRGPERSGKGSWELIRPSGEVVTVWAPFSSEAFRLLRLAHFEQIGVV